MSEDVCLCPPQRDGGGLTSDHSLDGLLKVLLVDGIGQMASSNQSGLVTNVGDVRA